MIRTRYAVLLVAMFVAAAAAPAALAQDMAAPEHRDHTMAGGAMHNHDDDVAPKRPTLLTGYGRGECVREGGKVTVELSSVNRKQGEISVALPRE